MPYIKVQCKPFHLWSVGSKYCIKSIISRCYVVTICHIALTASVLQARVLLRIKELASPVANLYISTKIVKCSIWQEGWQQKHQAVWSDWMFWAGSYHQSIDCESALSSYIHTKVSSLCSHFGMAIASLVPRLCNSTSFVSQIPLRCRIDF